MAVQTLGGLTTQQRTFYSMVLLKRALEDLRDRVEGGGAG